MAGELDTPARNPYEWTIVFEDTFQNLNNWVIWNNVVYLESIMLTGQVSAGVGLVITATDELVGGKYPSGQIESIQDFLYGYFECRCKIPFGIGIFPGWWLYDKDNAPLLPEIDIMEYLGTGKHYMTTHANSVQSSSVRAINNNFMTEDWHIFACRWDANKIDFFIDNEQIARTSVFVPAASVHLMLDLYVGNFETGIIDAEFPRQFLIDYIRVWQKNG